MDTNVEKMCCLIIYLLFFNCFVEVSFCISYTEIINLPQGSLRGIESRKGEYRQYLGIPYAEFMGRFLDPGPPASWSNVLNATNDRIICAQFSDRLGVPIGIENCLILNVYAPKQASFKKLLPVMLFIHGGDFSHGSCSSLLYNPEPLVKKGVVVVSINYRLGAFGFLCLRVKGAQGNAGLKDQIAALKWVQQNIKYFGGDSQQVTLFGGGAGAASVNLLMLSVETKGLFRRAIMQSGTALSPFAFSYDPITRASIAASKMGYNTKNPYELWRVFKNASRTDIIMGSLTDSVVPFSKTYFKPCAEKLIVGGKPILLKSPKQLLEEGNYNKIPVIIGYNDKEGIFYASKLDEAMFEDLNVEFEDMIPDNLIFNDIEQKFDVTNKVKDFYFNNMLISKNTTDNLIDYFSDILFHYPSETATEYHLQNTQTVFNYYFQYDSYRNLGKMVSGLKDIKGASHTDELYYMFQPILWPLPKSKKDVIMIDRITTMWSNFAKTGDPTSLYLPYTVKWKPSDNGTLRYLIMDLNFTMNELPNPKRIDFWRYIYNLNSNI